MPMTGGSILKTDPVPGSDYESDPHQRGRGSWEILRVWMFPVYLGTLPEVSGDKVKVYETENNIVTYQGKHS